MKYLLVIGILAMGAIPSQPTVPNRPLTQRETWWRDIAPRPEHVFRVDKMASLYAANQKRYQEVSDARAPGCPAPIVFIFHMRESTCDFGKHLHEGSSLKARTKWVPIGRPKTGNPPFTFLESAIDALYVIKSYQSVDKWYRIDTMIDWIERYNGLGYRTYHPATPSPYVVGGSNQQRPGKYVADGKFDKAVMDRQLGCLVVLKEIERRGLWTAPPY